MNRFIGLAFFFNLFVAVTSSMLLGVDAATVIPHLVVAVILGMMLFMRKRSQKKEDVDS